MDLKFLRRRCTYVSSFFSNFSKSINIKQPTTPHYHHSTPTCLGWDRLSQLNGPDLRFVIQCTMPHKFNEVWLVKLEEFIPTDSLAAEC